MPSRKARDRPSPNLGNGTLQRPVIKPPGEGKGKGRRGQLKRKLQSNGTEWKHTHVYQRVSEITSSAVSLLVVCELRERERRENEIKNSLT